MPYFMINDHFMLHIMLIITVNRQYNEDHNYAHNYDYNYGEGITRLDGLLYKNYNRRIRHNYDEM